MIKKPSACGLAAFCCVRHITDHGSMTGDRSVTIMDAKHIGGTIIEQLAALFDND